MPGWTIPDFETLPPILRAQEQFLQRRLSTPNNADT
jgi:hypothetical protein